MRNASSGYDTDIISVCTQNPHYFSWHGEPAPLITSAEHYGALINTGFDYEQYLDMLAKYELNYTRIYPGAYYEPDGMFIADNTLAPQPEHLLLPWARSSEPGCGDGGNRFDLRCWNDAYFERLHAFLLAADRRGIAVEICYFNCQYPENWPICPFNAANNIQGVGGYDFNEFQTTRHEDWLSLQKAYVRKITGEVNAYGNVILEICDEPTLRGTPSDLASAWISALVDEIVQTEQPLPNKHLIAQQLETAVDFTEDARVPVIVAQYILQNDNRQVGGVEALDSEYGHCKPIELNETAYFPVWYEGDIVASSRAEAWEFMVGGGAAFNQLNGIFTAPNPSGDTQSNREVLASLQALKRFICSFDLIGMRQDKGFIRGGVPQGAKARCIGERGRQYAAYLHHSLLKEGATCYTSVPGDYGAELTVELPAGCYRVEWIDPATGQTLASTELSHAWGTVLLASPCYRVDIALRVKRIHPDGI